MKKFSYFLLLAIISNPIFAFSQSADSGITPDLQAVIDQASGAINLNQFNSSSEFTKGIEEQISVDVTPSYPRPGEDVVIFIQSYSTNLDKAKITWRVNSQVELQQIGATKFTFTMGQLGESKSINIYVEKNGGGVIEKTYFFIPTEVDLIYSAETYVPPFYKGKSWPTHQSTIRVVALPRILDDYDRLISPDTYTYKWSRDGRVIQDQSGYGKNIFTYTNDLLDQDVKISVEVSPREYNSVASASIIIDPVEPEIVVYEKNPIYGTIFEQAITGIYSLNRNEITFEAIPYFFTENNLDFSWVMNGQMIQSVQNPSEITFRIEGEEAGRSNISLNVTNNDKILQSTSNAFTLLFEKIADGADFNF